MRLTTASPRAVLEVGDDLDDVLRALERDLAPLVAEAPAHRHPEPGRVHELHLALARPRLAVGHHPHVGGDAGVVEELLGQRDQRFEQIVLQDIPANLALAAAGVSGEERRAVHDDGEAVPPSWALGRGRWSAGRAAGRR
jgi:hypothetical protein